MHGFSAACDGRGVSGGYNALAPMEVGDIDEREDNRFAIQKCQPDGTAWSY